MRLRERPRSRTLADLGNLYVFNVAISGSKSRSLKFRMAWGNGSVRHGYSKLATSIHFSLDANFMPTLLFHNCPRIMPRISGTLSTILALFWFAQCVHCLLYTSDAA